MDIHKLTDSFSLTFHHHVLFPVSPFLSFVVSVLFFFCFFFLLEEGERGG